ncbi:MAG: ABC transporter ATP-binding protein [Thermomicrobiales bacterium]
MTDIDVTLEAVTKRFGQQTAVDGVSLRVERGTFLTLLGPSGCGKTTTLRMIGGFEHPDSGEVYIRGEAMGRRPPYQRDTSMVFQNYALFPHMSIADNIAFGLRERKTEKATANKRVEEMLSLVEMPGYGGRRPRQLSGGQQQRVALARSLILEPTVLLLDEPLGALDLKLRRQMQIELKRIQERVGITFIYVTHDQEEALTMSDRIAVMNRGRVEQEGTTEEIFERPTTRFVADFMGAENVLDAEVVDTDGASARLRVAGAEVTVAEPGLRANEGAAVMIRPETVALTDGDAALWRGVIEARVYKGSSISYQLRLADGTPLVAEVMRGADRHFVEGDAVGVGPRSAPVVIRE